jgi:hypothetical protein
VSFDGGDSITLVGVTTLDADDWRSRSAYLESFGSPSDFGKFDGHSASASRRRKGADVVGGLADSHFWLSLSNT